jgi:hypothetical protein
MEQSLNSKLNGEALKLDGGPPKNWLSGAKLDKKSMVETGESWFLPEQCFALFSADIYERYPG